MKNIMVVDDSRIMRNIVKNTFLELKIPCQFIEASNGVEALQQLSKQTIDLILLDWNMPELSGFDFLKEVRGMDKYNNLPIVMVTSEAAKFNVIEALDAGATAYIIKPVTEKSLKEKISSISF